MRAFGDGHAPHTVESESFERGNEDYDEEEEYGEDDDNSEVVVVS